MIKVQKKDFDIEIEIDTIRKHNPEIGAVSFFIGYVRNFNNNKNVKFIELEVYEEMAYKSLEEISEKAKKKWDIVDILVIHRFGKLDITEKIVLVATFSKHRKESYESCNFIMDYLKKEAPFWKKEIYKKNYEWLENTK